MYRRFGSRRAVGSRSGSAPLPPVTPVTIFGANLAEYWDATDANISGSDVVDLTGRIAAVVISPSGSGARPAFDASNALLNGAASVYCTPTRFLRNIALPIGLLPAGSRPCMWMIGYVSAIPIEEGDYTLMSLRRDGANAHGVEFRIQDDGGDVSPFYQRFNDGSNKDSTGPSASSAIDVPFAYASILNASNTAELWFDNTEYGSIAATTAAPAAIRRFAIGTNAENSTAASYVTFAQAGICLQPPTAGELTAFYAYAQSNYGVL